MGLETEAERNHGHEVDGSFEISSFLDSAGLDNRLVLVEAIAGQKHTKAGQQKGLFHIMPCGKATYALPDCCYRDKVRR